MTIRFDAVIRFDALLNFSYDPRTEDYRYNSGVKKGKAVPKPQVKARLQRYRDQQQEALVELADRDLKPRDFYRESKHILKNIFVAQFVLGVGGYEYATDKDWLDLGRSLRRQYDKGVGEDGKPFGLKFLAKEMEDLSPEMLRHRLRLYAQAGEQARWLGRIRRSAQKGFTHGLRVLGKAEHCPDCVAYSRLVPRRLDQVVLPGQRCQCRSNCKCSILFLTLEQAMARGGK